MISKNDPSESSGIALEQAELTCLLSEHLVPVQPSPLTQQALGSRLQDRVARSVAEHSRLLTVRAKNGIWQTLTQGIRFKMLWQGDQGNSVLIDFAPGAELPEHRHNWLEEGLVLRGGLQMGDLELGLLDYHVAPPGSRHERIQSRQGALAFLRGTSVGDGAAVAREWLGGLLPFKNGQALTVYANQHDGWQMVDIGLFRKILHSDGILTSSLYRIEPGGKAPFHPHTQNEECMMLSGDVFLGDILLQAGDYQLAPVGSFHGEAYSDVGGLLFVRGAAD